MNPVSFEGTFTECFAAWEAGPPPPPVIAMPINPRRRLVLIALTTWLTCRSAQTQGDVSISSVRLNLPRKNFLICVVVPDGGEGACIAAEADSGQGSAISQKAAYEFAREVHGERGAPSVAEGDNFPFRFQAFDDDAADIVYVPGVVARGKRFIFHGAFGQEFLCR